MCVIKLWVCFVTGLQTDSGETVLCLYEKKQVTGLSFFVVAYKRNKMACSCFFISCVCVKNRQVLESFNFFSTGTEISLENITN